MPGCFRAVGEEPGHLGDWYYEDDGAATAAGINRKCGRRVQLAAAIAGRGESDSALISAAMAG